MTEPIDHELLSRVLDDEASPDERALVAADPALAAQLERLRQAQLRLARPPAPLSGRTVDHLVEAAIAAADGAEVDRQATGASSLLAARARRTPLLGAIAAAAAVVVVLAVGVSVLDLGGGEDASQQADAPPAEGGDAAPEAQSAAEEAAVPDLGDADELAAVVAGLASSRSSSVEDSADGAVDRDEAVGDGSAGPSTTSAADAAAADGEQLAAQGPTVPDGVDPVAWCREQLASTTIGRTSVETAAATLRWRGEEAVAFLLAGEGGERVVVVSALTCQTLAGPAPTS